MTRLKEALKARYIAGYQDGYDAALGSMVEFLKGQMDAGPEPEPESTSASEPAGDANGASPSPLDSQPPYLQQAMQYLANNPGATAHHAMPHIASKNAFYLLVKRGLAVKRGSHFYLVER